MQRKVAGNIVDRIIPRANENQGDKVGTAHVSRAWAWFCVVALFNAKGLRPIGKTKAHLNTGD